MKTRHCKHSGFKLLEFIVVVSVIGMLASISIPYSSKAATSAQLQGCVTNQRILYDAVVLYEMETEKLLNGVKDDGDAIRKRLMNNGYIAKKSYFECPSSTYVDYNLTYAKKVFGGTICLTDSQNHALQ